MSIKNVKPAKGGSYIPKNKEKYIGEYPIVCRSSWEYKYCIYCDINEDILQWSSEPVHIRYFNKLTGRYHKYYPDFWIKAKTKLGITSEYLIEIKPKSQITKPKPPKRNTVKNIKNYKFLAEAYIKNLSKAAYAKKFAEDRNMKYIILTEDQIK